MNRASLRWAGFAVLGAALGCIGYWLMFTQFMIYDDEGYVLSSLRSYIARGGLYDRVFSQYGPFFYNFYDALHAVTGLEFDNVTGRLLTLLYWCGTALCCGGFTWRQTRSSAATLAASALNFAGLFLMTSEPIHPGGLLTLITAAATVGGAAAIAGGASVRFAAIAAIAGTAMALTKINVGVFFLLPAGAWLAVQSPSQRFRSVALWLTALGCAATPLVLMRPHWPSPWVTTYALIFSCGSLALLAAMHRMRDIQYGLKPWLVWCGSAALLLVVVVVTTIVRGTSLHGLIEGAILAPFRHPGVYSFLGKWQVGARELAVLGALVSGWYHLRWRTSSAVAPCIALLRIIATIWFFGRALSASEGWLHRFNFDYGPSLAALMVLPLTVEPATPLLRARLWLAWVFVWQTLQAYPVAGTQTSWGSFLWAPLCICGFHEAVTYWGSKLPQHARAIRFGLAVALTASAVLALVPLGRLGYLRYLQGQPLGLRGASALRLRGDITSDLRVFTKNIRAHGGLLFSDPGMFSFNIWSERPTPTDANVTHWFSLLSNGQQQTIVDRLERDPRAVIMVNRFLFEYLIENGFAPRGLLQLYIARNFAPAVRIDTYELWVHRGRKIAPLDCAFLFPPAPDAPHRYRLELVVDALNAPIAAAVVRKLYPPHEPLQKVRISAEHEWQIRPITLGDETAGAILVASTPQRVDQPARISFTLELPDPLPVLQELEVLLIGADGRTLTALRFAK